ncbi:MAG: hypothetical protein WAV31_05090 [Candidatus Moraniibacteriota bacterium]
MPDLIDDGSEKKLKVSFVKLQKRLFIAIGAYGFLVLFVILKS